MNIYRFEINGEVWYAEGENLDEGLALTLSDPDDPGLAGLDRLSIQGELVEENMTLEEFERVNEGLFG